MTITSVAFGARSRTITVDPRSPPARRPAAPAGLHGRRAPAGRGRLGSRRARGLTGEGRCGHRDHDDYDEVLPRFRIYMSSSDSRPCDGEHAISNSTGDHCARGASASALSSAPRANLVN